MKYSTILFDFGDTLTYPHPTLHWQIYDWIPHMIMRLHNHCYRLGIISNTHRFQDGYWVRNKLAEHNILQYFEMIITSANYGIHKPDMRIFEKAVDFMQLDCTKTIMVGDAERADGACQYFGIHYLRVKPQTDWHRSLYELLGDDFPTSRKLTNLAEYRLSGNKLVTTLKHMSEVMAIGDSLIAGHTEYTITSMSRTYERDDIFNKDDFIEFEVKPTDK